MGDVRQQKPKDCKHRMRVPAAPPHKRGRDFDDASYPRHTVADQHDRPFFGADRNHPDVLRYFEDERVVRFENALIRHPKSSFAELRGASHPFQYFRTGKGCWIRLDCSRAVRAAVLVWTSVREEQAEVQLSNGGRLLIGGRFNRFGRDAIDGRVCNERDIQEGIIRPSYCSCSGPFVAQSVRKRSVARTSVFVEKADVDDFCSAENFARHMPDQS
jgi:hypothetical protein